MGNYRKMKQLIQYFSIIFFTIFTMGLISCKKSTDSKGLQNVKTDSTIIINEKETVIDSTKKDPLLRDSTNKADFILPKGYKLFDKIQGDLNGDNLNDYVLITKGTDNENVVLNRFDEEVDRNRRGILIYLTGNNKTFLTTKNLNCFSSENEDGGVYFPPELAIDIENGKLYVHYGHGRYGYWKYTFRYQNSDFALIGYDSSENYGPITNRETSINFLTKKKLTKENVNQNTEKSGDEIFEDTWEDIDSKELYILSEITDFEELDVNR